MPQWALPPKRRSKRRLPPEVTQLILSPSFQLYLWQSGLDTFKRANNHPPAIVGQCGVVCLDLHRLKHFKKFLWIYCWTCHFRAQNCGTWNRHHHYSSTATVTCPKKHLSLHDLIQMLVEKSHYQQTFASPLVLKLRPFQTITSLGPQIIQVHWTLWLWRCPRGLQISLPWLQGHVPHESNNSATHLHAAMQFTPGWFDSGNLALFTQQTKHQDPPACLCVPNRWAETYNLIFNLWRKTCCWLVPWRKSHGKPSL